MLAAFIESCDPSDPAAAISVGERPAPHPAATNWEVVDIRAASLNHHDVFAARGGVLRQEWLPRIIGMDGAGVTAGGDRVVIHNLIQSPDWAGDPLLDPGITGLSEGYDGTFAEQVAVPRGNLLPIPDGFSFQEAACLPTAWLTAYRMLFVEAAVRPGDRVLVQGAAGGVASALVAMGGAAGVRMWVTGRTEEKRAYALGLGAELAVEPGQRLPDRVDAVMETVGAPTFRHSLQSLRKGGTVVVAGATGGPVAETDLVRVFMRNLRIVGTTMGTREELERMLAFLERTGSRPQIGASLPMSEIREAVRLMSTGAVLGKIVLEP